LLIRILVLIAISGWLSLGSAQAAGPELEVTARSGLRLRSQAGTSESILTTIPQGDTLEVIGSQKVWEGGKVWVQVRHPASGQTGWIAEGDGRQDYVKPVANIQVAIEQSATLQKQVEAATEPQHPPCLPATRSRVGEQRTSDCLVLNADQYGPQGTSLYKERIKSVPAGPERKKAFFEYWAPLAVYYQGQTGLPASVFLAQVAHETAWTSSNVFRKATNISGHSCFRLGSTKTFQIGEWDGPRQVVASCSVPRPANEGGYYFEFGGIRDASAAYIHNILFNPKTAQPYADLRQAVRQGKPGVEVAQHLSSYATDPKYVERITTTIRTNRLDQYESRGICR